MTVNANNAVLNGGYYALSGGKTTVTLTGDTVLTAPETTSGFSAVLGISPDTAGHSDQDLHRQLLLLHRHDWGEYPRGHWVHHR